MPKPRPSRPVGVRLLHTVDAYLRKKQRGKGDMSKLIMEAVSRTDLRLVPLITIHGRRQPTVAKVTQIVMPNEIRQLIEHWSENRCCSMNELLNSALVADLPRTRSERDARSVSSAHAAELDQMTAPQREVFFARLLSLMGSGAMPSLRSREGSYYEYDSEVGGTVEITQDGRRFLVESAGGGELVRVREVRNSPFLEVTIASLPRTKPQAEKQRSGSDMSSEAKNLQKASAIQGRNGQDSLSDAPLRPVLLLLVGASGSGRTAFYETRLKTVFPKLLRANASPLEQAETDQARKRLLKMGESFVYVSDLFDVEVIREASAAGYEIKAAYLATEDPNLNLGRVLIRVNNGGRFAPISRIASDYTQGLRQLPKVKNLTDDLMLFDNTAHGRDVRLVAHFQAGKLVKLAREIPRWAGKALGREFTVAASNY